MTAIVQVIGHRVVGTVEEVHADRISVLLDPDAPHATALNTGMPSSFPRINGYVLIPNEGGATACIISSVRIERIPFPKRRGMQQDFGLVDLPFPSRVMALTPIGTLKTRPSGDALAFEVHRGVDVFPSVGDPAHLPSAEQLKAIVEGESETSKRILIGYCPTAGRAPVHIDPDKLFGRHLAVLGNTGAGKSCSVAGLVRWSLDAAKASRQENGRPNARFIVFDPNGEYARAFHDQDVRLFQVGSDENPLHVPAWLWNGTEWSMFTDAAPGVQRPVLFEALRRLRAGLGHPGKFETQAKGRINRYKHRLNMLIQGGEHQQAGKREGAAKVLLNIQQDFTALAQDPECMDGDLQNALEAVASEAANVEEGARGNRKKDDIDKFWHNDLSETDLDTVVTALRLAGDAAGLDEGGSAVTDEGTPLPFLINQLPDYVEALASDHSGRDMAQFVDTLNLRIRSLLSGNRLRSVIHPHDWTSVTLESWLTDYIGANQAENGAVAVLDLSLVPSEAIHIIVSVLARMVFEALQRYRRENGEELPTTRVLEEAHTFIHRDLAGESAPLAGRECTRVFERIAREGRKFGLALVLASQRPSEVSPTVLSQCNTFLLHRLVNDRDQELVKRLVPDGLGPLLRELPSLPTRRAILLGWAAPAPTLIEVQDIPEKFRPHSPDPAFWDVWTGKQSRSIDWASIARTWQGGDSPQTSE
ncbi:MAG: DUF87 domain-containing protein [Rhodobacteraceae bacterium]|nr:DUF87 domain-containing protein [Paracoccaceae bacterium]